MGHSQADKAENHERIVSVAAARFRESGVDAIGVADLMKEAGLTHGGFYRHFESREELVDEAIELALREGGAALEAIEQARGAGKQSAFARVVDAYLSTSHRDNLATSCAITTLAGDVARSGGRARSAYTRQVRSYLEFFGRLVSGTQGRSRRAKSMAALSMLVGAVSLARAIDDEKLSREILKSAADALKATAP
jgi:TetR/AcrR family transcriptional repressor of nem operon